MLSFKPTYLSHVPATSFNSTNLEMATIVHRACADHPKYIVAYFYRFDLLFHISDSGDFLVILKSCRWVLLDEFDSSLLTGHFGTKKVCFFII